MKAKKVLCIALILGSWMLFGSLCRGKEDFRDADKGADEHSWEEIHIQEEILEGVCADALMYFPEGSFASYKTSLKIFEPDTVCTLFWPEDAEAEPVGEEIEEGDFSLIYQGESLGATPGSLRYFRDAQAGYTLDILAFGEEMGVTEEKELDFMPLSEARKEMETFLVELGIGGEPVLACAYGVTAQEMKSSYEAMAEDVHFQGFYHSGKLEGYNFDEKDEGYYLEYTFLLDGLPLYNMDSPALQVNSGIDTPLPARTMEASCFITSRGFRFFDLSGAIEKKMEKGEEQELISYEKIRPSIEKEYGDVIFSDTFRLAKIWPEYLPLEDVAAGRRIEVVPVWCCKFDIKLAGEEEFREVNLANRFHAFTGEEVP